MNQYRPLIVGTTTLEEAADSVVVTSELRQMVRVKNTTGGTLSKGAVVYVSGVDAGIPVATLAQATPGATPTELAILAENISPAGTGHAMMHGILVSVNTSAFTAGATLYLSASTPGALTSSAPSPAVKVARVLTSGVTGSLYIDTLSQGHVASHEAASDPHPQYALDSDLSAKQSTSEKGQANGYASLDGTGKVPASQLPSYVDDVLEYANLAAFPGTGTTGIIYVALDTNKTYRWSGSAYVELTDATAVWGSISGTLANQTDLQTALNGKEPSVSAGTAAQYYRGDKTWQTLNTLVVPESTNLYFTNSRARSAVSLTTTGSSGASTYDSGTGVLNVPTYTLSGLGGISASSSDALTNKTVNLASNTLTGTKAQFNAACSDGDFAYTTDIPTVNNGTLTLNVSGVGLSGSQSFTANQAGNVTFTVTSNATSGPTANTLASRDANGDAAFSNLWLGDGTTGAPAIRFSADTNTGFYRASSDAIGVVVGGTDRGIFTQRGAGIGSTPNQGSNPAEFIGLSLGGTGGSGVFGTGVSGPAEFISLGTNLYYNGGYFYHATGSYATRYEQTNGIHSWYTSTTTGTANGAVTFNKVLEIGVAGGMTVFGGVYTSSGTAASPAQSFSGDNNTGIYSAGADVIGFAAGGTQVASMSGTDMYLPPGRLRFPATTNQSTDPNTLDDYREADVTVTLTGCTTSPTATWRFTRIGRQVFVTSESALTGTSNSASASITGIPAEFRPPTTRYGLLATRVINNGATASGMINVLNDGTMTLYSSVDAGSFVSSGTKGINAFTGFSYTI